MMIKVVAYIELFFKFINFIDEFSKFSSSYQREF